MQTTELAPYLFFRGRCDEALEYYKQALGAQVEMVMRFNESPEPAPEGMLQKGFEKKIMHAQFTVGGARIMCSDGCNDQGKFEGFRLALMVPSVDEANQKFNALANGGKVDMPIGPTFWSPAYGMVTDKFEVEWMVMVPGQGPPK